MRYLKMICGQKVMKVVYQPQYLMIQWAKISNVTHEINGEYCLNVYSEAKKEGLINLYLPLVNSMYGISEKNYPNESSELSPMTEYAKSKVSG